MAQTLSSSKALTAEKADGQKAVSTARVAQKADDATDGVGYWVDATNYFDANGSFSLTNGEKESFRANLKFDGNNVTVSNLFDTSEWSIISTYYDINGTYDAANKPSRSRRRVIKREPVPTTTPFMAI